MKNYKYITLRQNPDLMNTAAEWFSSKWGVPKEAYMECMRDYLDNKTEYGWYLCMDGTRIIGGLGAIENDFHNRKDLYPNVCAVYTEESYRCQGIAGKLLLRALRLGISVYGSGRWGRGYDENVHSQIKFQQYT